MATGSNGSEKTARQGPAGESAAGIRRRELLIGGGAVAGAALIARFERDAELLERLLGSTGEAPSFTASMLRPEDMLAFDLEFFNASLQLSKGGVPFVFPASGSRELIMVAVFGPQAVAEEPFNATESYPGPPIPAQLGGPSRIAFAIRGSMPVDDEALLDWVTLKTEPSKKMLLVPTARSAKERKKGKPSPRQPERTETAIEAPYRMTLSPALNGDGEQFWRHRAFPLADDQRTELWHTRLVNLSELNGEETPDSEIRATWTPGWNKDASKTENVAPEPFKTRPMTLTPRRRSEIVSLSSDFKALDPTPGRARLLTLSALGSSYDLRFDFPDTKNFNVTHWSDRGTLGREHYAKVVERGNLFPFGHEAALIVISEREIRANSSGNGFALVRKRQYLVVKQKTKRYEDRAFPFGSVTVVDDTTPLIDEPTDSLIPRLEFTDAAFWPRVSGRDFLWTLAATDVEGARVEFQAPLIFVANNVATGPGGGKDSRTKVGRDRDRIIDYYNDPAQISSRTRAFGGQSVAYAKSVEGKVRQAAFATDEFELGAALVPIVEPDKTPRFVPELRSATIATPALAGAVRPPDTKRGGSTLDPRIKVKPAKAYVEDGFDYGKNAAQAYLVAAEEITLDYTRDAGAAATGALGSPNMDLTGLSRTLGPLGGKLTKDGTLPALNPADFLQGAKFLGVEFTDVLAKTIDFPDPSKGSFAANAAKVPRTLTETIYEDGAGQLARKIPREIRTEFVWEPELKSNDVFIANGPPGLPTATMLLRNVTVVPVSEQGVGKPRQDTTGEIKNFGLSLFGAPGSKSAFLVVYFNRFEFRSRNDQKPDVTVDVRDVVFAGPLEFVNDLRKLMSSVSGGSGLSIDVLPRGVVAGYGVDFPTVTTGVLTIANISFGASIEVPFDGNPVTTRFNFCEPKRPFLLTYTIFGGGGYADVAINSRGVESLTVSLEFGAATAINLGVASGSVQVMAGIIIKVAGQDAELTGYVRLRGEVDVLGLISASLEFNLSLRYDSKTKEAWGRATLTIEVEVLCFSESVSITAEKRFASGGGLGKAASKKALRGSGGGPSPISFAEIFSTQDWDTYRAAFAPQAF